MADVLSPPKIDEDMILQESFRYCEEQAKRHSSFYKGIMLIKVPKKRNAMFAIYAWLHEIDGITDKHESNEEKIKDLEAFHHKTYEKLNQKQYNHDKQQFWPAFCYTVHKFRVPRIYLEEMIAGQKQDLTKHDYQSFKELYRYCNLVASSVGLMCLTIWGYNHKAPTKKLAEECGVALQLTNILRDVKEDIRLHRVYFPIEFINQPFKALTIDNFHAVPESELLAGMQQLIEKAEYYYQHSKPLYFDVHEDGKLSFLALVESYYVLFRKIRNNPLAVLQGKRITVNFFDKFTIFLRVYWKYYTLKK